MLKLAKPIITKSAVDGGQLHVGWKASWK